MGVELEAGVESEAGVDSEAGVESEAARNWTPVFFCTDVEVLLGFAAVHSDRVHGAGEPWGGRP